MTSVVRFVVAAICFCVCAALPFLSFVALAGAQGLEIEGPCHENRDHSEKEQADYWSSASCRNRVSNTQGHQAFRLVSKRLIAFSCVSQVPGIVGHQLSNGHSAPLLI